MLSGKTFDNAKYDSCAESSLPNRLLKEKWPQFIRTYRNLGQFWSFIQPKFKTYEGGANIWEQFSRS